MTDYGSIFVALRETVRASHSPEAGWSAVLDETERHGAVPPELRAWDVAGEVPALRQKVAEVLRGEPIPLDVRFIYFGLFDARDEETDAPVAGFYVGGGAGDEPELAVAEGTLTYLPDSRHFISPLLDAVQAASEREGYDPALMGYALVFGAAALLAKHATEGLLDAYTLAVGFDEGDRAVIRHPRSEGGWSGSRTTRRRWWSGGGRAYLYVVDPDGADQPGAEWQMADSVTVEHPTEGTLVLDVRVDRRMGGIEFLRRL
jgi:hypothetical protein